MLKFGLFLSFMTVFFDALYDVVTRVAAVTWNVSPMPFVSVVYIAAATSLLIIAGPGRLGVETVRQPHTWLFSFLNINLSFIFLFILEYITTTEANLLVRFCIVLSVLVLWLFLRRKQGWYDWVGAIGVMAGCTILVYDLPADMRGVVVFLAFLYALILVLRSLIAEYHPSSNQAGDNIKDRCRVTGYVLLITGFAFLGLSVAGAAVRQTEIDMATQLPVLAQVFPRFEDFLHIPTILGAIFLGIVIQMPAMYFFFHATVVAKTEVYLSMTAILPLLTYGIELLVARAGVFDLDTLGMMDLLAGTIITLSGLFIIYMRNIRPLRQTKIASPGSQ